MQNARSMELQRDCEATQIPSGESVCLPEGTAVEITQSLGGSYTVQALGGLFRIACKDADALGIAPAASDDEPAAEPQSGAGVSEEDVWTTLKQCYDPEIPVNIVDLGLIYDLRVESLPSGRNQVSVKMTLTAPGCGMGPTIAEDARQRLLNLPGVSEANVEVVWDPPWHPSMISPSGRTALGLE